MKKLFLKIACLFKGHDWISCRVLTLSKKCKRCKKIEIHKDEPTRRFA